MTRIPQLHTIEECARILRLHPITVYRMTERGELRSVRISRRGVRVTSAALDAFVRERGGLRRPVKPRSLGKWKKRPTFHMTDAARERIAKLRAAGLTYVEIAAKIGCSKGAVWAACGSPHVADRPKKRKTRRRKKA